MRRLLTTMLIGMVVFLAGCGQSEQDVVPTEVSDQAINTLTGKDGLTLVVENDSTLILVQPNKKQVIEIGKINPEQKPPGLQLDTFQLSPSGKYVVWYESENGFQVYDIKTKQTKSLIKATDWFGLTPFYRFGNNEDILYYVDQEGKSLHALHIEDNAEQSYSLTLPMGTDFSVAPDDNQIVHVPGFGIDSDYPEHLVTNLGTTTGQAFTTRSELADRDQIEWKHNSQSLYSIDSGNSVREYSFDDLTSPRELTVFANKDRYTQLSRFEGLLFVETINQDWYVFDQVKNQIVAMIPKSVATGLSRSRIMPYSDSLVLIEEVIQDYDVQFNRLWISDYRGVKQILVPEYFQTTLLDQ